MATVYFFFFQAEDGIRDFHVTGVQTCALPICRPETDLVILGGYVYPRTGVALGPLTARMMQDVHVHQTIMSTGGITAKGLFNSNMLLVEKIGRASCRERVQMWVVDG